MMSVAYMGMDVHAGTTVLGAMNSRGEFVGNQRFDTSEKGIVQALGRFPAKTKYLALEESTLAHWVAQVAKPYVSNVLICDPRHNALIYGGAVKRDPVDTEKLCRLLGRSDFLKTVTLSQVDVECCLLEVDSETSKTRERCSRFSTVRDVVANFFAGSERVVIRL